MALFFSAFLVLAALAASAWSSSAPSITANKADYAPGETVRLSGAGWEADSSVHVVINDDAGQTWRHEADVIADANGGLSYEFSLPSHFVAVYTVTAAGTSEAGEPATATTTFTDAPEQVDFTQCANDSNNDDEKDDCEWTGGALNQNNAIVTEGSVVGERLIQNIAVAATHTMIFEYDFSKASKYAYDFLSNVDDTQDTAALLNACGQEPNFLAAGQCSDIYNGAASAQIPSDPFDAVADRETPASRAIKVGCDPACTGTPQVTFPPEADYGEADDGEPGESHKPDTDPDCFQNCGTSSVFFAVTFTTAQANTKVGLWMGAHIAASFDTVSADGWGTGFGGSSISGSPFHFQYKTLDGESQGQRDNQLQSGVVIPPASIIVEKQTIPDGATGSFDFTGDASGTISDGGQIVVNGLTPGEYTSTEAANSDFDLESITCNDANSTGDVATGTATFRVVAGETVKCTFTNKQEATVTITKDADPADGTDFDFSGSFGAFSLDEGGAADSVNTSETFTVSGSGFGTKTVTETGESGWQLTDIDCNAAAEASNESLAGNGGQTDIKVDPGDSITCTYKNVKDAKVTVVKEATPEGSTSFDFDATGTGMPADIDLVDDGLDNGEPDESETITLDAGELGTKTVTETVPDGWTLTDAACEGVEEDAIDDGVSFEVVAGADITCTFTDVQDAEVTVTKNAQPDGTQSFAYTTTGTGPSAFTSGFSLVDDGVDNGEPDEAETFTFPADQLGAKTVTEGDPTPAFDLTGITCSKNGTAFNGNLLTRTASFTLAGGDQVSCTFTNTQRGQVKVIKTVAGQPPSGSESFEFQIREGASTSSDGTVLETKNATAANGGVIEFETLLEPGDYQVCEFIAVGWDSTIQTMTGAFVPGTGGDTEADNTYVCVPITIDAGETETLTVDNTRPPGGMAKTIGFWKNWASCSSSKGKQQPILDQTLAAAGGSILIGDLAVNTCLKAVRILNKSRVDTGQKKASDPAFNLAAQLLAYRLNIVAGAGDCAEASAAATKAQNKLAAIDFNGKTHTTISKTLAATLNSLEKTLDSYNNNTLC